jgi:lipoate-protein ligase A
MVSRIFVHLGEGTDPYYNLALEQHLMESVPGDACILYLWQNRHTVVIGRNQNPWAECRTTALERDGGMLARRMSGGGAVFHDLGNLNFTFLSSAENYDLKKQFSVLCAACEMLGIHAEVSGRNDVTADGRKFSGNAFCEAGGRACHHGTILVAADMESMGKYLMPSRAKLQAKGVDSVRSRVVNLSQLVPGLTVDGMKKAMVAAFSRVYGLEAQPLPAESLDTATIEQLRMRNASWEWNYGKTLPGALFCEGRFPWGGISLHFQVEKGRVAASEVYSDAMEWLLGQRLREAFAGCVFSTKALTAAVQAAKLPEQIRADISTLLEEQNL